MPSIRSTSTTVPANDSPCSSFFYEEVAYVEPGSHAAPGAAGREVAARADLGKLTDRLVTCVCFDVLERRFFP